MAKWLKNVTLFISDEFLQGSGVFPQKTKKNQKPSSYFTVKYGSIITRI